MEILSLVTERFGNFHVVLPTWIVITYIVIFVLAVIGSAVKDN